jgi:adenylate cyclase
MMANRAKNNSLIESGERFRWEKPVLFMCGLLLTVAIAVVSLFPPAFYRYMESKIYDLMLNPVSEMVTPEGIVVVGIDDNSLARYGQWPWPRYRLAHLLTELKALGASSIGLDMIFMEQDRTSLSVIQKEMSRDLDISLSFEDVPPAFKDNDRIFASALQTTPTVIGYKFLFGSQENVYFAQNEKTLHPIPLNFGANNAMLDGFFLKATGVVSNLINFSDSAKSSGFVNSFRDADGVIRRVPLLITFKGKYYPSLALACVMAAKPDLSFRLKTDRDGPVIYCGNRRIPIDQSGSLLVRYRGKGSTFPLIPAGDVLEKKVQRERVQGKIVIVGAWATGLGEHHVTPMEGPFPGPEIHANVADNILEGMVLYHPQWARGVEISAALALGILLSAVMTLAGPMWCTSYTAVTVTGSILGSFWMFKNWGLYLSPILPMTILMLVFAALSILKYAFEKRRVMKRTAALIKAQDAVIISLSSLSETRDFETGAHILRTQRYVRALARCLAKDPKYADVLDETTINVLYKSAPLHDIGKVGIPDHILLKPGKLSDKEFDLMMQHTLIGHDTLVKTEKLIGEDHRFPYFKVGREMSLSHHEKWDGTGYPNNLKGEKIPLSGRLMALADVYDSLITSRVYKRALNHEEAKAIILKGKGSHFDPDIVKAFLEAEEEFKHIAKEFVDAQN